MKYLAALFLLPTLALAQAPEGGPQPPQAQPQQPPQPSFEQIKKGMQPMLEQSLPLMRETRECVSKATTKEATEECMITNTKKVLALQEKLGAPANPAQHDPEKLARFPEGYEWNEGVNQKILQNMDNAIKRNTAALECLPNSNTREEMTACMRGKLPQPAAPKP